MKEKFIVTWLDEEDHALFTEEFDSEEALDAWIDDNEYEMTIFRVVGTEFTVEELELEE